MNTQEKRFLLDFEVEAHACLNEQLAKVCSLHPQGEYEIHISNLSVKRGVDRPLLSVQIIIPASNIKDVKDIGVAKLKEYLYYLTFATNLSYKIHKLVRIIDWSTGLKERYCIQFEKFPGSELPYPLLNEKHFKSIEMLLNTNPSIKFKRALRWFASGVNAQYLDDQFQYFWFVLELLAQLHKNVSKVNDLCPKCKTPLYCESCDIYPTHRPYPKQAILQLMEEIISDKPLIFFEVANEIRNAIMHGDSIEEIEKSRNVELSKIVDKLGSVAWIAIYKTFGIISKDHHSEERLYLLKTNMYSHQVLTAEAHLIVYCNNPDEPKLSEFAKPEISLVSPEDEKQKWPPPR